MPDRLAAVLGSLFRGVCLLYPRDFRRLFLGDMTSAFAHESEKAYKRCGGVYLFVFCLWNFASALAGAVAEHFRTGVRSTFGRHGRWPQLQ